MAILILCKKPDTALQPVPSQPGDLILAFTYAPDATTWVMLHDYPAVAWLIDTANPDAGATPVGIAPLPLPPPNADPAQSPQFAMREKGTWRIPGIKHGPAAAQIFTELAQNGRKLFADFADHALILEWTTWAAVNPGLVLSEAPS
jgi:hypothetical protein